MRWAKTFATPLAPIVGLSPAGAARQASRGSFLPALLSSRRRHTSFLAIHPIAPRMPGPTDAGRGIGRTP